MNFPSIRPKQLAIFIGILLIIRIIIFLCERYLSRKFLSEKAKHIIKEYIDSIIIAGITALILIKFIIQPFYIPSGSMYPTLKRWDFILVNKFVYRLKEPQRSDIIVFHPPPQALAGDKDYIKRVVAVTGDTLEVKNGKLYINNQSKIEPYVKYQPDYDYPLTKVPEGNLFVMGDNRPNSGDSHVWGFLPVKNVIGKAMIIIWPPSRIKILK